MASLKARACLLSYTIHVDSVGPARQALQAELFRRPLTLPAGESPRSTARQRVAHEIGNSKWRPAARDVVGLGSSVLVLQG